MLFQRNCRRRILTGEEWRKLKNVKRTRNESRRNYYENIKQDYLPVFRRQMFSQAPKNSYPWHNSSHLEENKNLSIYSSYLVWQKTGGTLIPPITVSENNSPTPAPTQLPNHYKRDQNQSSHFRKKDINFSQTSICAQAEFLPLCFPQLQAAGRLRRSLPIRPHGQATHLWMRWLFSKCKTVDHGWLPPFFPQNPQEDEYTVFLQFNADISDFPPGQTKH